MHVCCAAANSGPITPAEVDINLNISAEGIMIVPVEVGVGGVWVCVREKLVGKVLVVHS